MFVETQEYARFREFCDACRACQYIGLCYGFPGVGKTLSARYYTNPRKLSPSFYWPYEKPYEKGLEKHVVLYTPAVANSPLRIARELGRWRHAVSVSLSSHARGDLQWKLRQLEESMEVEWFEAYRNGGVDAETEEAAEYARRREKYYAVWTEYHARLEEIHSVPTLVIIDEADRLKMASLEQVRELFDEGGMGLVLIGMPGLEKRLSRYAQLYSRVGFVHEFRSLAEKEVRGLLDRGWRPPGVTLPIDWVADEEAVATILRITDGNFRLLERLLRQITRVLEINDISKVTRAVVEVARESLVIGTE